ncbi:MAG TPA: N-acetylmuramoyl-L-alanine amidase [Acidimicrobiales bacterium]|nr:N-acetylmuramoyl-L-alanine amidase [Acidimicrobiales bacterium]
MIAVGLSVIPATTVHAQVVRHTRAAEVAGPLLAGAEVRPLPFPTRHAALYWAGNPDAAVTVAFSTDGTVFSTPVKVEHDEVGMQRGNGETYGAILPAGGATSARVTSDRPLGRVTILALTEDAATVEKTDVPKNPAGAQTADLSVVPRSGWNADESLRFDRRGKELWPPVFQTVQKVVVHHTAGVNGESGEAARSTIRSIYYYHAVTQGWGDIGYNFLIDAAGVVYKGRHSHAPGTPGDTQSGENAAGQGVTAGHAYGYNSGSVGVAMLGTYSTVDAPEATKAALRSFLTSKTKAHGLDPARRAVYTNPVNGTQATFENVPGHREVPDNATDCPGGYFQESVLRFMRSEIQLAAGPADVTPPADPSTLTAALSRRSAVLSWPASAGDAGTLDGGTSGVAGYDIWRAPAGGTPARVASTTALTWTDTSRATGTTYDYYVKTYDGAGNRAAGRKAAKAL